MDLGNDLRHAFVSQGPRRGMRGQGDGRMTPNGMRRGQRLLAKHIERGPAELATGQQGQQVFIDMHMVVDANDLPTAHRITELVEEHLEARFGRVRCTIHLEPREYASAAITFKGTHG